MNDFFEITKTTGLSITRPPVVVSLDELGRQFDAELTSLRSHCIERVIRLGSILLEAKELAGHGQWLPWLEQRDLPERTARRWMSFARDPEAARQTKTGLRG